MSTKIYNGYRKRACSLEALADRMRDFGMKAKAKIAKLYTEKATRMAVYAIDRVAAGVPHEILDQKGWSAISWASNTIRQRHNAISKTGNRDPEYDFNVSVCLIPKGSWIYALLYTENKHLLNLWEQVDGVEEYAYWNNTDQPDGISDRAWTRRGKNWESVLPGMSVPSEVGLSYDLTGYNVLPFIVSKTQALRSIPGLTDRAMSVANEVLMNQFIKRGINPKSKHVTQQVSERIRKYLEYRETANGKHALDAVTSRVRAKLKPKLTWDDLTNDIARVAKATRRPTPTPTK